MSKIKMEWVDTGWHSFQVEVPESKKAWERQENKRINHQVKHINRNQQRIKLRQFGRIR